MSDVYIYDAVRTPRGKLRGGALQQVTPIRLAASVLTALRERNGYAADAIDDVVFGCVVPVGEQGGDITRAAVLAAGYDQSVPGVQINRFCGSGLDAVNMAAGQVASGQCGLAIGGGVESMTRVPMGSDAGAWTSDPRETFASHYVPQGIGADVIATLRGYDRVAVDGFAVESQRRTAVAQDEGRFARSLVPVRDMHGAILLERDEHPRRGATLQSLAKLEPAFAGPGKAAGFDERIIMRYPGIEKINHVHTAANSSGIVDGAAAVLVGSAAAGDALGLKPRARVRGWATVGSEPAIMLTGPVEASNRALKRAGMAARDIDLFEVNEAFASVVMFVAEELGVGLDRVNVNGGAIALGHPLGATGAMMLGTVLDELERTGRSTGLITLCVAGGMGTAAIIERL
ncbi:MULTISPECIES: acetyl-CoA C-acetyltransferase [unclassified Xanthobacter]|uniref:acetyl-CoA C-acetyltransferase n=1 Tax=unclassified Xanthobacter TaxID=2623496 RepID=UPI001EDCABED|nr:MULTISPECIES: acetyl-CoA C-acetyltransferase [unclassified Xanthobacter]